ncbi:MAG: CPBP family intramembrane metalloprotease [Planctomycetes bacterium]|nr:CPBP family intramembrane metalloprotease [Planctomycetota bacterium]
MTDLRGSRRLPEDVGPALIAGGVLALLAINLAVAPLAGSFHGFATSFFARYVLSSLVGIGLVIAARRVAGDGLLGLAGAPIVRSALMGAGLYIVTLPLILWLHRWNAENVLDGEVELQRTMRAFLDLVDGGAISIVVAMTVVLVVAVPLLEEILFRGWLLSGIRESIVHTVGEPGASVVAVLASTAVFTFVHPQFTWLPIGVMGLILAILYARTRTLWPGVVFHGLHNLFTLYYPILDP